MKFILVKTLLLIFISSAIAQADAQLTFKGDFRFRNEQIKEEQISPLKEADRLRQRMRFRFGANAKVNDSTDVNFRLATGSTLATDTATTNQDFTDYYSKKGMVIDLAYFNHKLDENIQIWGGKTPLQFYTALNSDLIFDSDLTPEGLALKYKNSTETNEVFANAGTTWLSERFSATGATDNTDVGLIGAQAGFTQKFESCDLTLALAHYNFANIKGATAATAKGNSLSAGAYVNDYKLNVLDIELATTLASKPISIAVEYVNNTDVSNYNIGSNFGVRYGKLKDKDSWMLAADYREVEKDAVVGILSEADSSGGGADIRTTKITYGYQLAEKTNFMLAYLTGQKTISSTTFSADYTRIMADFNFYF